MGCVCWKIVKFSDSVDMICCCTSSILWFFSFWEVFVAQFWRGRDMRNLSKCPIFWIHPRIYEYTICNFVLFWILPFVKLKWVAHHKIIILYVKYCTFLFNNCLYSSDTVFDLPGFPVIIATINFGQIEMFKHTNMNESSRRDLYDVPFISIYPVMCCISDVAHWVKPVLHNHKLWYITKENMRSWLTVLSLRFGSYGAPPSEANLYDLYYLCALRARAVI